jgi:hypothetical protein
MNDSNLARACRFCLFGPYQIEGDDFRGAGREFNPKQQAWLWISEGRIFGGIP